MELGKGLWMWQGKGGKGLRKAVDEEGAVDVENIWEGLWMW